jgi:hypothetical protein
MLTFSSFFLHIIHDIMWYLLIFSHQKLLVTLWKAFRWMARRPYGFSISTAIVSSNTTWCQWEHSGHVTATTTRGLGGRIRWGHWSALLCQWWHWWTELGQTRLSPSWTWTGSGSTNDGWYVVAPFPDLFSLLTDLINVHQIIISASASLLSFFKALLLQLISRGLHRHSNSLHRFLHNSLSLRQWCRDGEYTTLTWNQITIMNISNTSTHTPDSCSTFPSTGHHHILGNLLHHRHQICLDHRKYLVMSNIYNTVFTALTKYLSQPLNVQTDLGCPILQHHQPSPHRHLNDYIELWRHGNEKNELRKH